MLGVHNLLYVYCINNSPLARRKAPAEGRRPEGEGANLDRHLVPYHGKQGESNLASSLFIYLYIYMYGTRSL